MESTLQLYKKWNEATQNVNRTVENFQYKVNSLRSKRSVSPSDIKNLVAKFDNYQNAKIEQDTYMHRLHKANFETVFKGKSYKLSKRKPKNNVKITLQQKYGTNRVLRRKSLK